MTWITSRPVSEFMTPAPPMIASNATAGELAAALAAYPDGVVVTNGQRVPTLVTSGDLVQFLTANPNDWQGAAAGAVPLAQVPSIRPHTTAADALELLRSHAALLVIEDGHVLGQLTARAALPRLLSEWERQSGERSEALRHATTLLQDRDDLLTQSVSLGDAIAARLNPPSIPPVAAGLAMAWHRRAARAAADVLAVIRLSEGQVVLLKAHVSGPHLAAAFGASYVRTLFQNDVRDKPQPADVLGALNRLVFGLSNDLLICAWCGLWDRSMQQLTWASAGHPAPLGGAAHRPPGPFLGLVEAATFDQQAARLETGELFVLANPPLTKDVLGAEPAPYVRSRRGQSPQSVVIQLAEQGKAAEHNIIVLAAA